MVDGVTTGYINQSIKALTDQKDFLLMLNKDTFSDLKIQLFSVLDAARDVGLKSESSLYRLGNNAKKINRYIGKRANWYYQHKYAVKSAQSCEGDKTVVDTEFAKLVAAYNKFNGDMSTYLKTYHARFVAAVHKDE